MIQIRRSRLIKADNAFAYSHNQLYGRWYICERGSQPNTNRGRRAALHTATHSALLYSASEIELLDDDELEIGNAPALRTGMRTARQGEAPLELAAAITCRTLRGR